MGVAWDNRAKTIGATLIAAALSFTGVFIFERTRRDVIQAEDVAILNMGVDERLIYAYPIAPESVTQRMARVGIATNRTLVTATPRWENVYGAVNPNKLQGTGLQGARHIAQSIIEHVTWADADAELPGDGDYIISGENTWQLQQQITNAHGIFTKYYQPVAGTNLTEELLMTGNRNAGPFANLPQYDVVPGWSKQHVISRMLWNDSNWTRADCAWWPRVGISSNTPRLSCEQIPGVTATLLWGIMSNANFGVQHINLWTNGSTSTAWEPIPSGLPADALNRYWVWRVMAPNNDKFTYAYHACYHTIGDNQTIAHSDGDYISAIDGQPAKNITLTLSHPPASGVVWPLQIKKLFETTPACVTLQQRVYSVTGGVASANHFTVSYNRHAGNTVPDWAVFHASCGVSNNANFIVAGSPIGAMPPHYLDVIPSYGAISTPPQVILWQPLTNLTPVVGQVIKTNDFANAKAILANLKRTVCYLPLSDLKTRVTNDYVSITREGYAYDYRVTEGIVANYDTEMYDDAWGDAVNDVSDVSTNLFSYFDGLIVNVECNGYGQYNYLPGASGYDGYSSADARCTIYQNSLLNITVPYPCAEAFSSGLVSRVRVYAITRNEAEPAQAFPDFASSEQYKTTAFYSPYPAGKEIDGALLNAPDLTGERNQYADSAGIIYTPNPAQPQPTRWWLLADESAPTEPVKFSLDFDNLKQPQRAWNKVELTDDSYWPGAKEETFTYRYHGALYLHGIFVVIDWRWDWFGD